MVWKIIDRFKKAGRQTVYDLEISPFRSYLRQFTGKVIDRLSIGKALIRA